jgi:hypothetical protein
MKTQLSLMKKLFLLISFAAPILSMAQSTTILPDAIAIPNVSVLPACSSSEKGKQVFNTTTSKMYYCDGTNWQEMTGGGFTLPYTSTVNSATSLLYLENTGVGRAIYGKSNSTTAVKGESTSGYGVYGTSQTNHGIYGESISSYGVYGTSSSNSAGYFEAYGSAPALYVASSQGEAANFRGNVKVKNELIVDDNKGIVRSNSSMQQKVVRLTGGFGVTNLAAGSSVDGALNYEDFGGVPTVTVGQVSNGTGDWHKISVVPFNVTATSCDIRFINLSNASITMTGTWNFLIIGPE